MGLENGKQMIRRVADLPGNAAKIGMAMALLSYDEEARHLSEDVERRTFYGGSKYLAEAIGRTWIAKPKTAEDRHNNQMITQRVSAAIRVLKEHGIVREIGRAVNGSRAKYEVLPPDLDPYVIALENTDFTPDLTHRSES